MEKNASDLNSIAQSAGATHIASIFPSDLTVTGANTAQTITLFSVPARSLVKVIAVVSKDGLKASGDATFNSTALEVGTADDPDALLGSTEMNANAAAKVLAKAGNAEVAYADPTDILLKVSSMAEKSLSAIDSGTVHILMKIVKLDAFTS